MRRHLLGPALCAAALAAPLAAQTAAQDIPERQRCGTMVLENVDRQGVTETPTPGVTNYYAGGNVRIRCSNAAVNMKSDSVASYGGQVVQFIGKVHYRDSTVTMDTDFGTYFKVGERWEARGHVVLRNLKDGSILRGPFLDYYRPIRGVRDTVEMYADQRPTVIAAVKDSVNRPAEPYVVVGDRIRFKGSDRIWAGGNVTIDRTDFRGRGDSLHLDTGAGSRGYLIGSASMRRVASDSFLLKGHRIDLTLTQRELTGVRSGGEGVLRTTDLKLDADTIGIHLTSRKVDQTLSWGKTIKPRALSADYEIRGDSLAIDTPGQQLREARAFGKGWTGSAPDSAGEFRDWLAGDTLRIRFAPADSSKDAKQVLRDLEARKEARAFYRMHPALGADPRPTITYTRAQRILVTMKPGDSSAVERVDADGKVDGINLQPMAVRRPEALRADSIRADSLRADSIIRARRKKP